MQGTFTGPKDQHTNIPGAIIYTSMFRPSLSRVRVRSEHVYLVKCF